MHAYSSVDIKTQYVINDSLIVVACRESACHIRAQPTANMAPKLSAKAVATSRTKAAGELLSHSKQAKSLADQRKTLKAALKKIAVDKRKANRQARKLKAKASKTDLSELMQMMIMKAYIVGEEERANSGGASSSTDPWIPKDAKEAFDKIQASCANKEIVSVAQFAKSLLDVA